MDRFMGIMGVAVGGAIGAVLRYVVSEWVQTRVGHSFAWGTLSVNLAGCLLIGLLFAVMHEKVGPAHPLRLFLIAGFLGALTTYSTFAFESLRFIQAGQWGNAFGNLVVKTVLGLSFCFVGMAVGRWLALKS